jgi:MFS family permease
VLGTREQRATLHAFLVIGALGPAVSFLIPLYIQIIQDRSTMFTAVAVVPYTAAIATSAVLVVRLYDRLSPQAIGVIAFVLVAAALGLLAFTTHNDWGTPTVIAGLIVAGLGEGALLTLLFNLLVALSPGELAADVGALRGVANNLSTALGTAFASVVAVALLSVTVTTLLNRSNIPSVLKAEVDLDQVNFVTNAHLKGVLEKTMATPEQVDEAVGINVDARLSALKASFLVLAGIALLAIFPATGLPRRHPDPAA